MDLEKPTPIQNNTLLPSYVFPIGIIIRIISTITNMYLRGKSG